MLFSNSRTVRLALASLLVSATLLGGLGLRAIGHESDLLEAQHLLLEGEISEAEAIFRRLLAWGHLRAESRAGLAAIDALRGEISGDVELGRLEPRALSRLPLHSLLRGSLADGRAEGTLALARLAERAGVTSFGLFRSAALVELGRAAEVVDRPRSSSGLRRRLAQALDLYEQGVNTVVLDRRGRRVGWLDPDGAFHFAEEVDPKLVPRQIVQRLERAPVDGVLRLAIDLELSEQAFQALRYHRGSVVVLDSWTGDVLAAVSDRKGWSRGGTPAFEERREPASISKIITTTAALRAGIDPDGAVAEMRCRGAARYNGQYLWCPSRGGRLRSLDRALARSCNVAFAELGHQVGRRRLLDELRRYGFASGADFEDGLPRGQILGTHGNDRQLADLAIGLEATDITPLHAALVAAVFANGGIRPEPRIFAATDGPLGLSPRPLPVPEGEAILDPSWLPTLISAMEAVAKAGGTAAKVAPEGFPVAMKTGTGAEYPFGYHVNYIGVGPLPNPRLAFAVRITHKKSSPSARHAGYDATRRLLRSLEQLDLPEADGRARPSPEGLLAGQNPLPLPGSETDSPAEGAAALGG